MTNLAEQTSCPVPALIVFGNDELGHTLAGWFTADECVRAERASGARGLVALRVTSAEERDLAATLPRGHLLAEGRLSILVLAPRLIGALRILALGDHQQPGTVLSSRWIFSTPVLLAR